MRPPHARPPLAGRYRLGTVIGVGGFGTVYEAYDEITRSRVAVKSLREVDPQRLFLFKQEFRLLADTRHPQLVQYYELFQEKDRWYLAMEYIEGIDLLTHVRGGLLQQSDSTTMTRSALGGEVYDKDGQPLTPVHDDVIRGSSDVLVANETEIERLRSLLPQLAGGLEHLHDNNLVHRDLTPRNIMIENTGRLIILDFGLALRGSGTSVLRNMRVGTPKYMAPEQISSEPSTAAADWYAVGCIMYEMLTGIAPFVGSSAQVLNAKKTTNPADPRELHPHLPDDLCALALEFLAFDPNDRPIDAGDRLRHCATAMTKMRAPTRVPASMPFIGRELQLKKIDHSWRSSIRDKKANVVLVRAPSGMGKSAFIERFFEKLPPGEQLILRSRCYQHESVPFKAIDGLTDAISEYLQDVPEENILEMLPDGMSYVTRLFPSLRIIPAINEAAAQQPPSTLDPHELRRRGFSTLRALFERLSLQQRIVVFIDDMQWGDDDSLAALVDILAPPNNPQLFMIMSSRVEDDGTAMLERITNAFSQVGISPINIDLGPLTTEEVNALQNKLHVNDSNFKDVMGVVFRDSGGHPLFMRELIAASIKGPLAGNQPTLRDLLAQRLLGLSSTARHLIEVAAVAGRPRSLSLLHQAIHDEDNLAAAIHQLGADRLARLRHVQGREELTVYHDKIAETAIALLSPERLRAHHLAIADALLKTEQPDLEAEALSQHFLAYGDQARGWQYGLIAAQRATESLAFERAVALYRTLLPIMPAAANRPEFLMKMGAVLANAGHGVEAARIFLEAGSDPRCENRQDALQLSAGQFLRSGYMDDGLSVAKQVLSEVGLKWHERTGAALFSLLLRRMWLRMRGIHFTERDPATIPAKNRLKMDALWSLGHGLGGVDTIRGAEFQIRHLLMALKAGDPYRVGRGVAWESILNATEGKRGGRRRAQIYYQAAQNIATKLGNEHASAWSWAATGYDHWCKGEWDAAIACNEKAARGYREECHDITWELGSVYAWSWLPVLCYSGRLHELRSMVGQVEREFGQLNDLYTLVTMRTVVSPWLTLADHEPKKAITDSANAVASWSKKHWHLQHLFAEMAAARAELYQGQGGAAFERLNACWPKFTSNMQHLLQNKRMFMVDLRGRSGAMAILSGELPASELHRIIRDAKQLEREKTPWASAYAMGLRAAIALIQKQSARAISYYELALVAFENMRMPLHAAATRIQLGTLKNDLTIIDIGMAALIKLGIKEPKSFSATLVAGPVLL